MSIGELVAMDFFIYIHIYMAFMIYVYIHTYIFVITPVQIILQKHDMLASLTDYIIDPNCA